MKKNSINTWLFIFCMILLQGTGFAATPAKKTAFDHDKTGFFLSGQHTQTACESCHIRGIFRGTPKTCEGCHSQGSQIANSIKSTRHVQTHAHCDDCHTDSSWSTVRMDHDSLTGSCSSCHNGQKARGMPANHVVTKDECNSCHLTVAWKPARFDHSNITAPCANCHIQDRPVTNHTTDTLCGDCHRTEFWIPATAFNHSNITDTCQSCHNGLTAKGWNVATHIKSSTTCDACHTPAGWTPVTRVDHDHVTGTCASCHTKDKPASPDHTTFNICSDCHNTTFWVPANPDHGVLTAACSTCHAQDKPTTMSAPSAPNHATLNTCDDCHGTVKWTPATFNHDTVTGNCSSCHNNVGVAGKDIDLTNHFTPTQDCNACHNTSTFTTVTTYSHNSANYPGDHTGSNPACNACHTGLTRVITIPYTTPGYKPECAACHKTDFDNAPRDKHKGCSITATTCDGKTISGFLDCESSCHEDPKHRVSRSSFR